MQLHKIRDPNSYRIWTDTKSLLLFGWLEVMKGNPFPKWGRPVWAEIHKYEPNQYSDFADNGDWIGGLPADVAHLMYDGNDWQKVEWAFGRRREPPKITTYYKSSTDRQTQEHELHFDDNTIKIVNNDEPNWYYEVSPDEYFNFCYKDACKNLMGDTVYANVSETVNGKRKYWGNSQFVNSIGHDTAHHFIGAINE